MTKKLLLTAVSLLALVAMLAAAEMTADELIGKYNAACGGEKNLMALKSMTVKGSVFVQGMSLDMNISYVLPGKSYTEMMMNNVPMQVIGTNGNEAWTKNPMGTYYLTGEELESALQQADLFPLLHYKSAGAKVKYLGEDLVKGAKAYKLEYVSAKNDTALYYFDATTFYVVKEKRGDATILPSDYRKAGDILLPYKMSIQSAAQQLMMTIDTVAVNPALPDSLFMMPKGALPIDSLKAQMEKARQGAPGGPGGGGQ